jgi:hypothetical protein
MRQLKQCSLVGFSFIKTSINKDSSSFELCAGRIIISMFLKVLKKNGAEIRRISEKVR